MKWFRNLAAELFPSWHERRLIRQLKGDNHSGLDSLAKLRRTLGSANLAEKDRCASGPRQEKSSE